MENAELIFVPSTFTAAAPVGLNIITLSFLTSQIWYEKDLSKKFLIVIKRWDFPVPALSVS